MCYNLQDASDDSYYIYLYISGFNIPLWKEVVSMRAKLDNALNAAVAVAAVIDLTVKFVRGIASVVDASRKAS